ncbi:MAG: hypothetical protein HY720_31930 [Planctomycetes bacterium]|nr:hypothetical protein [Planctomycetota bacterium]
MELTRAHLAVPMAVMLAVAARAQEDSMKVQVEPASVEEGRSVRLAVRIENGSSRAVALDSVSIELSARQERFVLSREERGVWLRPRADEVVTAVLTTSEGDLGPIARAPMPPRAVPFGPDAFVAYRVLAAGESISFSIEARPLAGRDRVLQVSLRSIDAAKLGTPGHPAFARAGEERTIDLGLAEGEEEDGPDRWPGPASGELAIRRWRPMEPGKEAAGAVLLEEEAARAASFEESVWRVELRVNPGSFPSSEALARAGRKAEFVHEVAFLPALELWAFEDAAGTWIVERAGEPRDHQGRLAKIVSTLADSGKAAINFFPRPGMEGLARALQDAGFLETEPRGKISQVEFEAKDFLAVLDLVEKEDCVLSGDGIRPAPELERGPGFEGEHGPAGPGPDPGPGPREPQGCEIDCPECRVLFPGLADCRACGGSGTRFQAARMADSTVQRQIALERRGEVDAAVGFARAAPAEGSAAAWQEAETALYGALVELLIYGEDYAAAYEGREETPADPLVADALALALRARLRLEILEARQRAGGGR